MAEKTQWKSPLEFVLAIIGAAVGLGNIWRFSYVTSPMEEAHFLSLT